MHHLRFSFLLLLMACIFGLNACGYSEDEWQAQLAKYGKLDSEYKSEKEAHEATQADLDKYRQQVADLTNKLEEMGVNVEELSTKLQQEGTEKNDLLSALEEYKRRAAQLEKIRKRFEVLREKLKKLTNLGLKVSIRHNRMVISLPGDVLFPSGSDKLKPEALEVLDAVAEVIRSDAQLSKRYFQVAGHTDAMPLRGGQFKDNWGLSTMRARSVLVYLVTPTDDKKGGGGLDPTRLHAAGYGETDPIGSNETPEGRQTNRRVELVLMPDVSEMLDLKGLL